LNFVEKLDKLFALVSLLRRWENRRSRSLLRLSTLCRHFNFKKIKLSNFRHFSKTINTKIKCPRASNDQIWCDPAKLEHFIFGENIFRLETKQLSERCCLDILLDCQMRKCVCTGTTRAVTREKIQGASGTREEMKLQPTESKSKRL
jgi:hypothetical protein